MYARLKESPLRELWVIRLIADEQNALEHLLRLSPEEQERCLTACGHCQHVTTSIATNQDECIHAFEQELKTIESFLGDDCVLLDYFRNNLGTMCLCLQNYERARHYIKLTRQSAERRQLNIVLLQADYLGATCDYLEGVDGGEARIMAVSKRHKEFIDKSLQSGMRVENFDIGLNQVYEGLMLRERYREAVGICSVNEKVVADVYGESSRYMVRALRASSQSLSRDGNPADALSKAEKSQVVARAIHVPGNSLFSSTAVQYGILLTEMGQYDLAREIVQGACTLALNEQMFDQAIAAMHQLAAIEIYRKDYDAADKISMEMLDLAEQHGRDDGQMMISALQVRSMVLTLRGDFDGAVDCQSMAIKTRETLTKGTDITDPNLVPMLCDRADLLLRAQRFQEARSDLITALDLSKKSWGVDHSYTKQVESYLQQVSQKLGK